MNEAYYSNNWILLKILTIIFFIQLFSYSNSIQILNTNNALPEGVKKIPVLNVKVEESDRETSVIKRYTSERRLERDRLRDLESGISNFKRRIQQVIKLQNLQLASLSNIAQANLKMLSKAVDTNYLDKEEKDKK